MFIGMQGNRNSYQPGDAGEGMKVRKWSMGKREVNVEGGERILKSQRRLQKWNRMSMEVVNSEAESAAFHFGELRELEN